METQVFQTNPRLRGLLLILIFTFAASGIVLAILSQIQAYHREQVYLATEAALPAHKIQQLANQLTSESEIVSWKTYRNEEYGFEIRRPESFSLEEQSSDRWHQFILRWFLDNKNLIGIGIRSIQEIDKIQKAFIHRFNGGGDEFSLTQTKTIKLGNQEAGLYIFDSGGVCEPTDCMDSFVAIIAQDHNFYYELYFYGDTILQTEEKFILNSFKFIK